MTTVHGAWLDQPATQDVCRMLETGGAQALFVGGCVRNALIGAPVGDIDIATDATPDRVIALAKAAGLRAIPTGIDHGTVTVVAGGIAHEITTFRRDVEADGRHAIVAFSTDVAEDAARRDFTMNALYADARGQVQDPLGGIDDLRARRVRFIGDATARIREDYLRVLRYFRFHAWYGDQDAGLDGEALAAISENLDGLETLSRERVGGEMLRLLGAADPVRAVAGLAATGALARLFPGSDAKALGPLVHLEQVVDVPPDPIRRLASLNVTEPMQALRLSRPQAARLDRLREAVGACQAPAELGYRLGAEEARDVILLRGAMLEQHIEPADLKCIETGATARFPISAKDLMPEFTGTALGEELARLEQTWIASGFTATRDELLIR
ncbi:CCA tRNA nucleotidyltransferase [Arenibacterium halophilum]|uniref:CCA tRNA nucleotidyltransferase n=1 Tax=Arenibacterium halophilum TaxID=2583821 RepID=A0ABY2X5K6_9RHOB|nr:CCA tRNA nucleotidyltransferase [Arenibacterium halophilum]TMV10726.1 CCA tRNA nucleotidyltransferase [Arenibacterium halophilum]